MLIKRHYFNKGNEIDVSMNFNGCQRLSIRKVGAGEYELYAFSFDTKKEHIHANGSLQDVIDESNRLTGYHDEIV